MSSLADTYASACGVPLAEISVQERFFPLDHPLDKVILVHAFGGGMQNHNGQLVPTFPAKIYSYFAETLELLKPVLEPLGYRFYQIGAPGEPPLRGAESLCGKTDILQCHYLVKRAALLIGNDSMWQHLRGAARQPLVALFGPTTPREHGPHWHDPAKTILIESHRFGQKPSFASAEYPKTLDVISPEQIANAALRLLGQPPVARKSLYFGPEYNLPIVEIVPNCVPAPQLQMVNPVIRADYHFDEQLIAQNLQIRKCSVITNREISPALLSQLKQNISVLKVELTSAISIDWVRAVKRVGVPLQFFTLETDEAKVRKMRLDLFDVECYFDTFRFPDREKLLKDMATWLHSPLDKELNLATLRFKTLKVIISDAKIYLSNAHRLAGVATDSVTNNEAQVIDSEAFWQEQSHHYYYQ